MNFKRLSQMAAGVAIMALMLTAAHAVTVNLNPTKDATLPESATGVRAMGDGGGIFAGRVSVNEPVGMRLRRAILQFDVSSIPSGATIDSASLSLFCSASISAGVSFDLHKVTASWTEGPTLGTGSGGGIPGTAVAGDVTWTFRTYNTTSWTTPGGDFAVSSSATQSVGAAGSNYVWSSAQMAADVQDWLDNPGNNNGWILIGGEGTDGTAKKFDDKTTLNPPVLTINYSGPASVDDWTMY